MLHLTNPASLHRATVQERVVMQSELSAVYFHDEEAAFAYVEARL